MDDEVEYEEEYEEDEVEFAIGDDDDDDDEEGEEGEEEVDEQDGIELDANSANLLSRYLRFLQRHLRNARARGGGGGGGQGNMGGLAHFLMGHDVDDEEEADETSEDGASWNRAAALSEWQAETRAFAHQSLGRRVIESTRLQRCSQHSFSHESVCRGGSVAAAGDDCAGGQPSPGSVLTLLAERQASHRVRRSFQASVAHRFLPHKAIPIDLYDSQAFCGKFSSSGRLFMSAAQDRTLRIYDTSNWRLESEIVVRDVGWSVISTDYSPDERWAVASAWSECAYLYRTRSSSEQQRRREEQEDEEDEESANEGGEREAGSQGDNMDVSGDEEARRVRLASRRTRRRRLRTAEAEAHDNVQRLDFEPQSNRFCLFSIEFSSDSSEVLGGSSDCGVYLYNLERRERTLRVDAHNDDVNAIKWADAAVFYSGSDDRLVKIWDRRTLSSQASQPVGVFAGHTEGITHIDARGDGRHLISNGKDQSIKLWDMRRMAPEGRVSALMNRPPSSYDYRYGTSAPATGQGAQTPEEQREAAFSGVGARRHRDDSSIMTYRGAHRVYQTLLRAYFSPMHTTGGAYIVAGSYDGKVAIYDLLTGTVARTLTGHTRSVRDVSWHPYDQCIASTSWDGSCLLWSTSEPPIQLSKRAKSHQYTANRARS